MQSGWPIREVGLFNGGLQYQQRRNIKIIIRTTCIPLYNLNVYFQFFCRAKKVKKVNEKCLHHDANMNVVTLSASHCKCRLISFITCILASKYYNFSSNISFTASFFSAPRAKFCNFLLRLKAASVLCGWEETFTGRSKNSDTRRLC